ncbi:unknown [Firmicutes bacterium CAG:94]|nr:unknown [Firmicutes bacterium CAG:94]
MQTEFLRCNSHKKTAQHSGYTHNALCCSVMLCGESKNSPHQVRKADHHGTGYKQAGQGCKQEQFEDTRLLPAQEVNTDGEVLSDDLPDAHSDFRLLIVQANEALQNGSEEKADHRSPEDRSKSKSSVNQTAQKRSDEPSNGLYLIYRRIAFHQIVSGEHLGDAGLYRGRLKGG